MKTLKLPVPAKVLLVDDDWRQMELRACILSMAGFPVLTARGPVEALSIATRYEQLDVAVVDYEMPIMNGATLADRLKLQLPKLNVVLYSAAVEIPSHDLHRVDTLISKGEGVSVLLRHLWSLSTGYSGQVIPPYEARDPPNSLHATENRPRFPSTNARYQIPPERLI